MRLALLASALCLSLSACATPEAGSQGAKPGSSPAAADAATALPKQRAKPEIRMYALDCGHISVSDMSSFDRAGAYNGRKADLSNPCFLIRHPKGDMLWDAGLSDTLHQHPDGLEMGPFRLSMPKTLKSQLADLGVSPANIKYFAFSHSHFDHSANANDYAGSTWLVNREELPFMFSAAARANGDAFSGYSKLENSKRIEFDDHLDVFGDGTVIIFSTHGHTPGHTSLLVRLRNSKPILLSGDLYMSEEGRKRRDLPAFDDLNPEQTLHAMDRFEAVAAATGARVIVPHDPIDVNTLPVAPQFLD